MNWLALILAGIAEIGWAAGLYYTQGFTRLWPSIGTALALILSIALLSIAMRTLPMGTAYVIWVGIGTLGTVVLGIWLFNEPASLLRLACLGLILVGIIGLKLTD